MPVDKYTLQSAVYTYFIHAGRPPLHPITADDCAQFAYNFYSMVVAIPTGSGTGAYAHLLNYVGHTAAYYGINLTDAAQWLKDVPGLKDIFFQYIKDNYRIETNSEIIQRKFAEAMGYISETLAGGIWAAIKPFLGFLVLGVGGYVLYKEVNKRYRKTA